MLLAGDFVSICCQMLLVISLKFVLITKQLPSAVSRYFVHRKTLLCVSGLPFLFD